MSKKRIGILVSGRGSNMVAIAGASKNGSVDYDVAVCISDKGDAPAIDRAKELGIPVKVTERKAFAKRRAFEAAIGDALDEYGVDLVVLAGFMRLLSPYFIKRFAGRIVNIHPSLLPAFAGLHAQKQAWDYGVRISGLTIHFVDEGLDSGPIIFQFPVPVKGVENAQELADKILKYEHFFYPLVIDAVVAGDIRIQGRQVRLLREIKGEFNGTEQLF